jgi:hypothetical protein
MSSAIVMHNAKNVILRNVWISGFRKGVEAVNSNLLLNNVHIRRCNIGLNLINSNATIHNSMLIENSIDIIVNRSTAFIIESMVRRIMEILPNGDYRINPYKVWRIANEIINTRNEEEKRSLLRKLLKYLEYVGYGWIIYQILKEFLSYLR